MSPAIVDDKTSPARAPVRQGRPPKELAGAVEERILEAAQQVFLERGFEGASVEEIADAARAGKPTIYARYPNKQALCAAAFTRALALRNERVGSFTPAGKTMVERLESIGAALLRETLTGEWIGLIRVAMAEARRFPELGSDICALARQRGSETVARLLRDASDCGELAANPALASGWYQTAGRHFSELILLPFLLRALAGDNMEALHAEIPGHVRTRVAFFLAACRNGGVS
jgi:AcrR family transcriptional regulator